VIFVLDQEGIKIVHFKNKLFFCWSSCLRFLNNRGCYFLSIYLVFEAELLNLLDELCIYFNDLLALLKCVCLVVVDLMLTQDLDTLANAEEVGKG